MDTEKNQAFQIPWTFQWPEKNPIFPGYGGVTNFGGGAALITQVCNQKTA
jgi:hypothetical protein